MAFFRRRQVKAAVTRAEELQAELRRRYDDAAEERQVALKFEAMELKRQRQRDEDQHKDGHLHRPHQVLDSCYRVLLFFFHVGTPWFTDTGLGRALGEGGIGGSGGGSGGGEGGGGGRGQGSVRVCVGADVVAAEAADGLARPLALRDGRAAGRRLPRLAPPPPQLLQRARGRHQSRVPSLTGFPSYFLGFYLGRWRSVVSELREFLFDFYWIPLVFTGFH